MQKKIKILLVILAVLIFLGGAFCVWHYWLNKPSLNKSQQPQTQQNVNEHQPIQQQQEVMPQANPASEEVDISETTDAYLINAKYPKFSGISNFQAVTAANQALKNIIEQDVKQFKIDAAKNGAQGSKSSFSNIYEVLMLTNNVVSVRLNILYAVSGTQAKNYEEVFNYNFKDNKQIALADLFNPGSDYLSLLSKLTAAELTKQLQGKNYYSSDTITSGTAPKDSNFSQFVFLPGGLAIIFNPAQVTLYDVGIQYVNIPWSQVAGLNSNSLLMKLITK